jgi:UDP-3-O-acyl-N-acetylglucosamine deacetylase
LAGLLVDDVVIEITGDELPIGDGSAALFVELLEAAGIAEHTENVDPLRPSAPSLVAGEKGECIVCVPADDFRVTVVIDYPGHPFIGTQAAEIAVSQAAYRDEIANARTYGFLSELEWLHARGLGLGASRDNVIVLSDDGYDTPLRHSNELARHKMLDVIGDLALVGRPLKAHIFAVKPSHSINTKLASQLILGE